MTNNPPRDRNLKQHSVLRESEIMKKASEPNCDLWKETQQHEEREWLCWNYRTQMPWSKGWTYSSRMFDWIVLEHGYILSPDNQVACMKVLIAQRMCSHVIHPTPICRNAMVILSIRSCTGLHFKIAVNLNLSASSCLVCLLLPWLKLVSFCLLLYYCLSSKVKLSQVVPGMPPLPVRPIQILLSPDKASEDGYELSRCLYVPSSYYESTTTVVSLLRLSFQLQILAAIPKSSAVLNLFQISLVPRNLFELFTTCVITWTCF